MNIVPGKSDAEKAEDFRERSLAALEPLLVILNEAAVEGFAVNFTIGPDGFKRTVLQALTISKVYG